MFAYIFGPGLFTWFSIGPFYYFPFRVKGILIPASNIEKHTIVYFKCCNTIAVGRP